MDFLSNFLAVAEKVGLLFLIILLGFICQRKKSAAVALWKTCVGGTLIASHLTCNNNIKFYGCIGIFLRVSARE